MGNGKYDELEVEKVKFKHGILLTKKSKEEHKKKQERIVELYNIFIEINNEGHSYYKENYQKLFDKIDIIDKADSYRAADIISNFFKNHSNKENIVNVDATQITKTFGEQRLKKINNRKQLLDNLLLSSPSRTTAARGLMNCNDLMKKSYYDMCTNGKLKFEDLHKKLQLYINTITKYIDVLKEYQPTFNRIYKMLLLQWPRIANNIKKLSLPNK